MASEVSYPTICGPGKLPIARTGPWAVHGGNLTSMGGEELKATPGAGSSLYLTHVTMGITSSSDVLITLKNGDGDVLFGPFLGQNTGFVYLTHNWEYPLMVGDNQALDLYGDWNRGITICVEGFTGQLVI